MVKRLSATTALLVVFAFLFVSIAHACSGLGPVGVMIEQSSRNAGMADNGPCNQHKEDVCKSVRDSFCLSSLRCPRQKFLDLSSQYSFP